MKRSLFTIFVFFLLPTNLSFGNGGPVAWTGTTPIGGIGLVQQQSATLEEENLNLKILDFNSYSVHAEYLINNSAKQHVIKFGVPVRWTWQDYTKNRAIISRGEPEEISLVEPSERLDGLEWLGPAINIEVNGDPVTCSPEAVIPVGDEMIPGSFRKEIRAWCLSEIVLKEGANKIVLDYKTELEFRDAEYSKSAFTEFSDRTMVYWLYPAGFWAGPAKNVKVQIQLGPYTGFVKDIFPESFHVDGNEMTWVGKNVDFKKTAKISIELEPGPLEANQIATWNASDQYISFKDMVTVNASSTLAPHGSISYSPVNVLDGSVSTAWCSAKQSGSEPVFIQFEANRDIYRAHFPEYCRIEGLIVTDGYMKNQSVYLANNRVRKISIGTCDGRMKEEFDLSENSDVRFAARFLDNHMPEGAWEKFITEYRKKHGRDYTHPDYEKNMPREIQDFILDQECFRIEILEVEKGRDNDTCISEVSLVINCG